MRESTRNYNNQWIIKSSNAIEKAIYNLDRIYDSVKAKGDYPDIISNITQGMTFLMNAKRRLIQIQMLFNDPRSNKIEVI